MRFTGKRILTVFTAILLFSSITIIDSAAIPTGPYVPISIEYDFHSDYGYDDYIGFYVQDNAYLIGYNNNEPTGVSSSDSLMSNPWAVRVLVDDEHDVIHEDGTPYYFENGYSLKLVDILSSTEAKFVLRKDGTTLDNDIRLVSGQTYIYKTDVSYDGATVFDFPVLIFTLGPIVDTSNEQCAGLRGMFQVDETAYEIELADRPVYVTEEWSLSITAPNSVQDVTIGIGSNATDKLDSIDTWTLPPYPINKTFLILDKCYSKNIKPGITGASWDFVVTVPEGETTTLDWDPDAVEGVNIYIMDGTSEISPEQTIGEGSHRYTIYATYGEYFDPIPTIYITPPSGGILREFTLEGTITDNNLQSAVYRVNEQEHTLPYVMDNNVASFSEAVDLDDGNYVIEVVATDSESITKSVNFEVDKTNPDVNIDIDVLGDNALITVSASDENSLSLVECRVENDTGYSERDRLIVRNSNSFEQTFTYYNLNYGDYEVDLFVEDCVGNIANEDEDFDIIDSYPPEITINSPVEGVTYASFPSINVTTDEEATFAYSLNGNNSNTTSGLETYMVEGANTLVIYATDLVGNTASEDVTFYYLIEEEDWNPWNDIDSEDGALIATSELQEAIGYWLNDSYLSTGELVTTHRLQYLIGCWLYDEICEMESVAEAEESSSESMASITANRTVSSYNVTPDSTFTVTVEMTPDMSIKALLLDEDYPNGWNITNIDDDESSFKNLTNEWIWPSTISGNESHNVTYNVTVPGNLTGGMYNISGNVSAYEVNATEVDGDNKVYVMDDWNPWNDWDSENGRYISNSEIQLATIKWKYQYPIPRTGEIVTNQRFQYLAICWRNGVPC